MSLQLLAKQMEAKGRKGDSVLVHMTPSEVAALQKMAESVGGSLSVNPETGLVEASFLRSMLPMLAGIGLSMIPGVGPLMASGVVGGGTALATGSIGKGLMAGLGAAGGAGMGAGLTAAGTAAAQAGAMQATLAGQAAAAAAPAASLGAAAAVPAASLGAAQAIPMTTAQGLGQFGLSAANSPLLASNAANIGAANLGAGAAQMGTEAGALAINQAAADAAKTYASKGFGSRLGEGVQALGSQSGRDAFFSKISPTNLMSSAASLMGPGKRPKDAPVDDEMFLYSFDPGATGAASQPVASSAERRHFRNEFSPMRRIRASEYPVYAAQGGLMSLAAGGETGTSSEGMSGASKAAFDYLMGDSGASQAGLSYLMGNSSQSPVMPNTMSPQSPMAQPSPTPMASNQMFSFDPTTGFFTRNPSYVDPNPDEPNSSGDSSYGGAIASFAKGGMASGGFVVPADVVSALGNGSTDAGLRKLNAMMGDVKPIKGKGDGLSDSIATNIDGKQPARVADGEAYIDPKTVKRLGGAKKLYALMDKVREQAHGKTTQQRKVNPARVMA